MNQRACGERSAPLFEVRHGDCLEVLRTLADASVDAVVTDPPYGLSFMGKKWDYDVPSVDVWTECLRVLKPGGHLLAFAGTRTQHRMAVRIEDAGFDIRDMIAWVYASGFPKSLNIGCKCHGKSVPYGHAEQTAEHGVRSLRAGDVPASIDSGEERREVLLAGVPERGAPEHRASGAECESGWPAQSVVEGRILHRTGQGLSAGEDAESSEGAGERIRSGAPDCGGDDARPGFESGRGSASQERGSRRQQAGESGSLRGSQRALDPASLGVDGRCSTCGGIKALTGWGTALKPALEPITVARKPLVGTVAANVMQHGTGAINVDGCRVDGKPGRPGNLSDGRIPKGDTIRRLGAAKPASYTARLDAGEIAGRWPANLIHDGSEEVLDLFPDRKVNPPSGISRGMGYRGGNVDRVPYGYDVDGSAARFFYCPKTSKADRDDGLDQLPTVTADPYGQHRGRRMDGNDTRIDGKPPATGKNNHPTVKPTDLMRYLCRLVTPPGGLVLDPFTGSGSTGRGAVLEGFRFLGIEREAEYVEIARRRIAAASSVTVERDLFS